VRPQLEQLCLDYTQAFTAAGLFRVYVPSREVLNEESSGIGQKGGGAREQRARGFMAGTIEAYPGRSLEQKKESLAAYTCVASLTNSSMDQDSGPGWVSQARASPTRSERTVCKDQARTASA
jgi:hypothetical protein